jgi:mannose-6-phosphate isomerase-like protein (cupin superfamily)
VKQGKQCSWHYHNLKDETFYLQSGELRILTGWSDDLSLADSLVLRPGQAFHVPRGLRHRFFGSLDSYMFEFSTQHFGDDSFRVQPGD